MDQLHQVINSRLFIENLFQFVSFDIVLPEIKHSRSYMPIQKPSLCILKSPVFKDHARGGVYKWLFI